MNCYVQDGGRRDLGLSLLVEIARKAVLVEFSDKRRINEIRGFGVPTAFAQEVDDELDTPERWISERTPQSRF